MLSSRLGHACIVAREWRDLRRLHLKMVSSGMLVEVVDGVWTASNINRRCMLKRIWQQSNLVLDDAFSQLRHATRSAIPSTNASPPHCWWLSPEYGMLWAPARLIGTAWLPIISRVMSREVRSLAACSRGWMAAVLSGRREVDCHDDCPIRSVQVVEDEL